MAWSHNCGRWTPLEIQGSDEDLMGFRIAAVYDSKASGIADVCSIHAITTAYFNISHEAVDPQSLPDLATLILLEFALYCSAFECIASKPMKPLHVGM